MNNKWRSTLSIVASCLVISGCSLAPEYTRPESPVPGNWPTGDAYENGEDQAGALAVEELRWRDFIMDENLREVVRRALDNNRNLRLAALNVDRARALYGVQRDELYPALDAGARGAKQRSALDLTKPGNPRTNEQYAIDLGMASWEIDFFGRIRSLEEQALQEFLATEQARRGAQIALVSETAKTYLTLAADMENLKLARSMYESQREAYQLIKRRYDMGLVTELDLRRAETPVESARVDIARYRRMVAQDRNALNLLMGSPVPQDLLPRDMESVQPPRNISAGLSSAVLLRRPDIMAAEHRLKGAYASIGAARAAFFPRISLTTSIGTASSDLSGLFSASSDTWNFAPRIVLPIFDARIWSALRVSEADQKIILTRYEKTIQEAFREVADSLATQGTIDEQLAAQQALVKATEETYRLSAKRYDKGIENFLSVLDAQRNLFAAQKGLVLYQLAKLANQMNLYAVLGGGGE